MDKKESLLTGRNALLKGAKCEKDVKSHFYRVETIVALLKIFVFILSIEKILSLLVGKKVLAFERSLAMSQK